MERQHEWVARHGWKRIRTKTKNRWKSMLVFDLLSGFEIIGLTVDGRGEAKIILEMKDLHETSKED